MRTPPLPLPRIDVAMLWHRRQEHDAGARWLRTTVGEVVRGLDARASAAADSLATIREEVGTSA